MSVPSEEKWNIEKIFTYKEREQEHPDDEIIYYDCELLVDFGPFKKGHQCHIAVWPQSYSSFTMRVGCDSWGSGGEEFVPVWTHVKK